MFFVWAAGALGGVDLLGLRLTSWVRCNATQEQTFRGTGFWNLSEILKITNEKQWKNPVHLKIPVCKRWPSNVHYTIFCLSKFLLSPYQTKPNFISLCLLFLFCSSPHSFHQSFLWIAPSNWATIILTYLWFLLLFSLFLLLSSIPVSVLLAFIPAFLLPYLACIKGLLREFGFTLSWLCLSFLYIQFWIDGFYWLLISMQNKYLPRA